MQDPTRKTAEQRVLWKPNDGSCSKTIQYSKTESIEEISQRFEVRPQKRSLFQLCANSVVVVQEFALTSFLLARHQLVLLYKPDSASWHQQLYLELSTAAIVLALLMAVVFSSRADQSKQQDRKTKFTQRSRDAILLALLLRWLAGILQSLTASYSSDTVEALALAGMTVHLIFCDYSYANGRNTAASSATTTIQGENAYPPFLGGIYSLNAAFFSTMLLVSRLPDRLSAYFFSSLAILIFAYYPATRHAISASYPAMHSAATWLVTALICSSTVLQLLVLGDPRPLYLFLFTASAFGFMFPLWKYVAQNFKVLHRGPWDIPTTASMQLDRTFSIPDSPKR